VREVVEANLAQARATEKCVEVAGEGGGFDGVAVGAGKDVAAVPPGPACLFPFRGLLFAVVAQ
jgi:hypothetical protein